MKRYLLARLVCSWRGHDWSRWATKQTDPEVVAVSRFLPNHMQTTAPYGERKCRRCGKTEIGAAPKPRKKRPPNFSDTVQFVPVASMKDDIK